METKENEYGKCPWGCEVDLVKSKFGSGWVRCPAPGCISRNTALPPEAWKALLPRQDVMKLSMEVRRIAGIVGSDGSVNRTTIATLCRIADKIRNMSKPIQTFMVTSKFDYSLLTQLVIRCKKCANWVNDKCLRNENTQLIMCPEFADADKYACAECEERVEEMRQTIKILRYNVSYFLNNLICKERLRQVFENSLDGVPKDKDK